MKQMENKDKYYLQQQKTSVTELKCSTQFNTLLYVIV